MKDSTFKLALKMMHVEDESSLIRDELYNQYNKFISQNQNLTNLKESESALKFIEYINDLDLDNETRC